MKRRPVPTNDEINEAIDQCLKGRGTKLARIIKGCSVEDLAKGLSYSGPHHDFYGFGAIATALSYASGRRDERARAAVVMRDIRKRYRLSRKEVHA